MGRELEGMHPELRWRVMEVAAQCRRRRWMGRLKQFGWIVFGLTCAFTLLLALLSPDGKTGGVLFTAYLASVLCSGGVLIYRALREPATLQQVALYIDEHHPELENRITSALDLGTEEHPGASTWLIERFLEETVPLVRTTSFTDVLNYRVATGLAMSAGAMLLSSGIVIVLFSYLWLPSIQFILPDKMAAVIALPFTIEPGNVRIRVGDNVMVWVRTQENDRALQIRSRVAGGVWQVSSVDPTTEDGVYYHQFVNIQLDIQYQVQYGRRRSPVYQITAWTPPEVESIDLIYHYPDYLRRPPREVPNSGNIAAIEGTIVDMEVWVNKALHQAELVFDSGERVALERRSDRVWIAPITITQDDSYRVELLDLEDAGSEYNPQYTITMARDKPPEIRIDFPRGDNEVTLLEEVPFDFNVTDDYGFDAFGLQYEVAGREPVRIALNEGSDLILKAEGHHQIMLEDLGLEVGDFITWTVWANDTKPDRNEFEVMGDPYFLEIRPFKREYREALTGGGGGGGGGMQDEDAEQAQKDVLIATWNLRREARYMDDEEFYEKRDVIVDTQEDLLDKVAAAGGMARAPSKEMLKLRESMRGSVDALTRAALPDPKADLSSATVHQQMALRLIARMKPRQAQVQQTQGGGGGGGGGGAQNRPDISELEMARNRNFYEQENLTREQQEAADEVLKKIKELARRQQNVNEELTKLISELQKAETEEERERLRLNLERLRDEMQNNLERLDEASQDLSSDQLSNEQVRTAQEALEQARRQMNRSLEQMERDRLQQARTSGTRAMDALRDIEEHLEQFGRGAAAQRMRELQQKVDELRDRQHEIAEETEQALEYHRSPSMADQQALEDSATDIKEEKRQLAKDFVDMMNDASELAERSRQTQELMSRKLGDWMRETSREGILEDIEESEPLVEYGIWDSAAREEEKIARKFDAAAERLRAVAESLVQDDLEGMQKALERMDRLLDREEVAGRTREDAEGDRQAGAREGPEDEEGAEAGGSREEQDGETPGEGEDAESRVARAQEGGGQGSSEGEQSAESRGDSQGSSRADGTRAGGLRNGFDARRAMRDFADRGYQDWLRDLRDAETLLPAGTQFRTEVTRIRERIEMFRRDWRARALAPQYDLFLEVVARPLEEAAARLQREIEKSLSKKEFLLVDEGDIPDRYKERVANYFKRLSDAEGAR